MRGRKASLDTGITTRRGKPFAYVTIAGTQRSKTFPIGTADSALVAWRESQINQHGGPALPADAFALDVQAYLRRIATQPTMKQKAAHLQLWLEELGATRGRHTITEAEVEEVLDTWTNAGLAPGTVRKRRTTLQSFFVKMNGKRGANPVKKTPIPVQPKPEARHLARGIIERAIAAMPTHRSTKDGAPVILSLAPIRARVLATTGLPPGVLKRVQPHDLVLTATSGTVRVLARKKGGGVEARTLPLAPDAREAFRAFQAAHAFGPFATESLNRTFKKGCKAAGVDPRTVHLYDLRHSFLTDLYRETRDLATVGRLGLHAEGSVMTARYAQGANRDVDAAAVAALGASWARQRQQGSAATKGRRRRSGVQAGEPVSRRRQANS